MASNDHNDLRDMGQYPVKGPSTYLNGHAAQIIGPKPALEQGGDAMARLQSIAGKLGSTKATKAPVLGTQIGGDHYTRQKIQPIEYVWANGLGFSEGNIVKYVTRWKYKGGIKDLRKAHHHLALLIEEAERAEREDGVKYGLG